MYSVVTHEWADKIRVDFFLEPTEPFYDQYYVRQPVRELTEKETAKLTVDGVIAKADYEAYVDKFIGWQMVNTPFNCHMMGVPKTVEDLDDACYERIKGLQTNLAVNIAKGEKEFKVGSALQPKTIVKDLYPLGIKLTSFIAIEVAL